MICDIVCDFVSCCLLLTVLLHRVMNQFLAARYGYLQELRDALTVDNVNDVDDGGFTALHWAADGGHVDCINYCIEMGANVNAHTGAGSTPLHFASTNGNVNVVRVLLNAGALVDATDRFGWTPLNCTIQYERVAVSPYLIDRGAKVSNVKLGNYQLAIPDWVAARSNCRCAANTIIGIHKYRRTNVTGNNDNNVIRLISKHIWSTRMVDVWVTPIVVETKS
jgi:hypothetical protein